MQDELEQRYKDALRAARDRIRLLQEQVEQQSASRGPVAIIGMACRLPGGANDVASFLRLLNDGYDASSEIPVERWDAEAWYHERRGEVGKSYVRRASFLDQHPGLFDAEFFQIPPAEAEAMDPQQRLLLELSWLAFEDAGIPPQALRGSDTGVFVGFSSVDYLEARMHGGDVSSIDPYSTTGVMGCSISGRISYFFDLQGPSVATDTACSSSLVSIHAAMEAIRSGECSVALAAGVNLMLTPVAHVGLCAMNSLAPDGRCKTFSDRADGFGRGEGAGVLILKRLSDAVRDGDTIHALLRGGAVGHGGRSNGFTAPNSPTQERIIRRALADASLAPNDIGYIESHGTGTPLGDPIEIDALGAVFAGRAEPLPIGAVKPNIGHLEAAAGIASVIKAVACVRDGNIPPTTHCDPPSTRIDWDGIPLQVVRTRAAWNSPTERVAGISSFGISGTGAHLLISEHRPAPQQHETDAPASTADTGPGVVLLSARTPEGLRQSAADLAAWLENRPASLHDAGRELALRRTHFPHRLAAVAPSADAMRSELLRFCGGEASEAIWHRHTRGSNVRPTWLFSGQGSQTPQMGQELYRRFGVFRQTLDHCDAIARETTGESIRSAMFAEASESQLDRTRYTQPAIFAFQVALAELWKSLGVTPARLIGHSIGEYATACVAGVLTLEESMRLVLKRADLVEQHALDGGMAALFLPEDDVRALLNDLDGVVIAAVNAPGQTVVAGLRPALTDLLTRCRERGIGLRELRVSHAFHAPTLEPVLPHFERALQACSFRPAALPIVSTCTGQVLSPDTDWRSYFLQQMRHPVRFHDALTTALQDKAELFLELGASPVLTGIVRRTCGASVDAIESSSSGLELERFLLAAGRLHNAGTAIDWRGVLGDVSRPRPRLDLPGYPFQRRLFYIDPVRSGSVPKTSASEATRNAAREPLPALLDLQARAMQTLLEMQAELVTGSAPRNEPR